MIRSAPLAAVTALLLLAAPGCATSDASPAAPAPQTSAVSESSDAPASNMATSSAGPIGVAGGGDEQAGDDTAKGAPAGPNGGAAPSPSPSSCSACLDIEKCNLQTGACEPNCSAGEVYVPRTGPEGFVMGQAIRPPKDRPHKVVLTRPFCIDANEITAGEYEQCVKTEGCTKPRFIGPWGTFEKKPDHPVNKIDWKQARHFCEQRGKTLPTEAQWEWAATGGDGRKWPWGNEQPTCEHADFTIGTMPTPAANAGCHGGGTSAVGAHPKGDRAWPSGVIHDLAGNVWEWCFDNYVAYPAEDQIDPVIMTNVEATHVVRGGGWNRSVVGIQTAYRGGAVVDYQRPGLGGRCARNARQAGAPK